MLLVEIALQMIKNVSASYLDKSLQQFIGHKSGDTIFQSKV